MAVVADELQQLRDIHLPEAPGWWPPAPGWWLLALLVAAAVVWAVLRLRDRRRRTLPLRYARAAYAAVYRQYRSGEMGYREYLNETDELIKRALIHGLGDHAARRASGEAWLEHLDGYVGEPAFSRGPGRALGDSRFSPQPAGDAEALDPLVTRLLASLRPPPRRPLRRGLRRSPERGRGSMAATPDPERTS